MKTLITVCWSQTVEVDVDPVRLAAGDEKYMQEIRDKAIVLGGDDLDWKTGMVTDCESFPQLAE